uniref:Uncharacterized protein n=1 Tax=Arundo donax TaxID=35708 RepID=A0A0A9A9I1_ARUDO
MSDYRVCTRI